MKKDFKIMVSAGELSGDVHGAKLVTELKKIIPQAQFLGMGHQNMAKAGVEIKADITTSSTVGILEPLKFLPKIFRAYYILKKLLKTEKPDLLIVIDYQGFHMKLIKAAKAFGIPVAYYIAPQEWQWGTQKGGLEVIKYTDLLLCVFKEAEAFYTKLGGNAKYIGHPLLDIAQSNKAKSTFYKENKIDPKKKILAIFPGSRTQEINNVLPVLLAGAKTITKSVNNLQIIVSISSPKYEKNIKQKITESQVGHIIYYSGNQYDLIKNSSLSLCPSGTITLEHAIIGTPFIANYRFSKLSYFIIKALINKKFYERVKFIALPNILLKRKAFPEFLQNECTPENIAKEAISILSGKNKMEKVNDYLGDPGVVKRAAEIIKTEFLPQT
ncbi:lipid-A-disaccharide synthase [Candidatus Margulisiibacteriota bacterium]